VQQVQQRHGITAAGETQQPALRRINPQLTQSLLQVIRQRSRGHIRL
jgi:hypothetical protein